MGIVSSIYSQSLPPAPHFGVADIPDLSGKVIIVTGGNAGIGKETVKALLTHNAKVYMASRSRARAEEAIASLKADTGKEAIFLELDLASLSSIEKAAAKFSQEESVLHVLFNNAGVMVPPIDQLTAEGVDIQFGTNVLGHFYFTKLLLPILLETAKSSPDRKARVVNTSSLGHLFNPLLFDTFEDGPARRKLNSQALYNQSKRGNVVFAIELAKRYGDQGIVSTSLNPGNIMTDLQRHYHPFLRSIINLLLYAGTYGALTQLWAGTSPETVDFNGKYLIPWARVGEAHPDALNSETGVKLWEWMESKVRGR